MENKKIGRQTVRFAERPVLIGRGNVVGEKEGKGPLAKYFDMILEDDMFGEKSWEKAESKMLKEAMNKAVARSGLDKGQIDAMLSGDLLNQLMSSSFTARDMQIPFLGLYGACSTMTESLLLGSMLIDGGFARNVLVGASSHLYGRKTVQDAGGTRQSAAAVSSVDYYRCGSAGGVSIISGRQDAESQDKGRVRHHW